MSFRPRYPFTANQNIKGSKQGLHISALHTALLIQKVNDICQRIRNPNTVFLPFKTALPMHYKYKYEHSSNLLSFVALLSKMLKY